MIRIVLTALKGGTGVSTMVSGLCQAAAHEELDVLCVDHDNQDLLKYSFGMVGLADGGEMKNGNPRIRLKGPGHVITSADMADVVVTDLPRSRPDLSSTVMGDADAVVLVVSASALSVAQAPAIKQFLDGGENRFLLLNQEDARSALKRTSSAYLKAEFGARIIGHIRQDGAVEEALASLEPLARSAPHSAVWSDLRSAFAKLLAHMNDLPVPASRTA